MKTNEVVVGFESVLIQQGITQINKLGHGQSIVQKLGVQVTYQLACVGIESVLTGVLLAYDEVIEHGNIALMLKKLSKHMPVDASWGSEARFVNRFGDFCSLDVVQVNIPSPSDILRIIAFADSIAAFGHSCIKGS